MFVEDEVRCHRHLKFRCKISGLVCYGRKKITFDVNEWKRRQLVPKRKKDGSVRNETKRPSPKCSDWIILNASVNIWKKNKKSNTRSFAGTESSKMSNRWMTKEQQQRDLWTAFILKVSFIGAILISSSCKVTVMPIDLTLTERQLVKKL